MEIAALHSVVRHPSKPWVLSAVKSNLGHTESAAGLTGLFRFLSCERLVGKNLHFNSLNSFIGCTQFESMSAVLPLEVIFILIVGLLFCLMHPKRFYCFQIMFLSYLESAPLVSVERILTRFFPLRLIHQRLLHSRLLWCMFLLAVSRR